MWCTTVTSNLCSISDPYFLSTYPVDPCIYTPVQQSLFPFSVLVLQTHFSIFLPTTPFCLVEHTLNSDYRNNICPTALVDVAKYFIGEQNASEL